MTDEQTVEAANDEQPAMAAADELQVKMPLLPTPSSPVSPDNELSDNADDKT